LEIDVAEVAKVHDSVRIDVIQAVGAIAQDRELLQRSAELARQARDGTLPTEVAARQIAEDSPEVASLLDRAPAAARKVLIWVLLAAIQILAAQAVAELRDQSATPADVERIVAEHDRDMQREVQAAVERALQDYYSELRTIKPPAK
jgi:hypothetical protein